VCGKKLVFFRACYKIRLNTHEPTLTKEVNNSLEKLIGPQLGKKFPIFSGN
jgi:hypothetical protein